MNTASRVLRKISLRRAGVAVAASGALAMTAALALAGPASASPLHGGGYQFRTVDNAKDVAFNQLLGVNNEGVIAGYFGSGAHNHPNKGYVLSHGAYRNENFPGSVQTQVTGLNDEGVTVGFWSTMNTVNMVNDNFGFFSVGGRSYSVNFPTGNNASPPVNQLLGVNDHDVAVGFYTDANGTNHGYEYNIGDNRYRSVTDPYLPGTSLSAAAINDEGDVAGLYTNGAGTTDGFLKTHHGQFIDLAVPGASSTMALGVNGRDEVVGTYTVGSGSTAVMHGFTWTPQHGFRTIDDPNGVGTTTINGVNDRGQLVGFYVDGAGNTDGFVANPQH